MDDAIHSIYDAIQYLDISETHFFLLLLFINMGMIVSPMRSILLKKKNLPMGFFWDFLTGVNYTICCSRNLHPIQKLIYSSA